MPCNTAHIFINNIRKVVNMAVMSIIEETEKKISRLKLKRPLLISTKSTTDHKLYTKHNYLLISDKEQRIISNEIYRLLSRGIISERIQDIINKPKYNSSDSIVLGCTDLYQFDIKSEKPIINSTQILINAAIKEAEDE